MDEPSKKEPGAPPIKINIFSAERHCEKLARHPTGKELVLRDVDREGISVTCTYKITKGNVTTTKVSEVTVPALITQKKRKTKMRPVYVREMYNPVTKKVRLEVKASPPRRSIRSSCNDVATNTDELIDDVILPTNWDLLPCNAASSLPTTKYQRELFPNTEFTSVSTTKHDSLSDIDEDFWIKILSDLPPLEKMSSHGLNSSTPITESDSCTLPFIPASPGEMIQLTHAVNVDLAAFPTSVGNTGQIEVCTFDNMERITPILPTVEPLEYVPPTEEAQFDPDFITNLQSFINEFDQ